MIIFSHDSVLHYYVTLLIDVMQLGRNKEAIDDCTAALDLDSSYQKAQLKRARIYLDLEQYEEAVRDFDAASKADPGNRGVSITHLHPRTHLHPIADINIYITAFILTTHTCIISLAHHARHEHVRTLILTHVHTLILSVSLLADLKQELRNAQLELKKSQRKDYYKILEITKVAPLPSSSLSHSQHDHH